MNTQTVDKDCPRELMTMAVTVTAKSATGTAVDCDFSGAGVIDNAIFVDKDADTTIAFSLVDNSGQGLQFDTNNPFGNQHGHCPKPGTGPKPPCSLLNPPVPTGTSFTISVRATTGRAVNYYLLNFTRGFYCDPIIIHD